MAVWGSQQRVLGECRLISLSAYGIFIALHLYYTREPCGFDCDLERLHEAACSVAGQALRRRERPNFRGMPCLVALTNAAGRAVPSLFVA